MKLLSAFAICLLAFQATSCGGGGGTFNPPPPGGGNFTERIVVVGHTDNQKIGSSLAKTFPSNWSLGGARAVTIVRLFEDAGVAPQRLLAESAGEHRPRADNTTAEGREKNRRIEVRLRPVEVQTASTP